MRAPRTEKKLRASNLAGTQSGPGWKKIVPTPLKIVAQWTGIGLYRNRDILGLKMTCYWNIMTIWSNILWLSNTRLLLILIYMARKLIILVYSINNFGFKITLRTFTAVTKPDNWDGYNLLTRGSSIRRPIPWHAAKLTEACAENPVLEEPQLFVLWPKT